MNEHRGFTDDNRYKIGEKIFTINEKVSGAQLVKWRRDFFSVEITDPLERMKKGEEMAREIIESCLIGANYEELLKDSHPRELEGAAADLFIFLYLLPPERERTLLNERLKASQSQQTSGNQSG